MINESLMIEMAVSTIALRRNISNVDPMDLTLDDIDNICEEVDSLLHESHLWEIMINHQNVIRDQILMVLFDICEDEFVEMLS